MFLHVVSGSSLISFQPQQRWKASWQLSKSLHDFISCSILLFFFYIWCFCRFTAYQWATLMHKFTTFKLLQRHRQTKPRHNFRLNGGVEMYNSCAQIPQRTKTEDSHSIAQCIIHQHQGGKLAHSTFQHSPWSALIPPRVQLGLTPDAASSPDPMCYCYRLKTSFPDAATLPHPLFYSLLIEDLCLPTDDEYCLEILYLCQNYKNSYLKPFDQPASIWHFWLKCFTTTHQWATVYKTASCASVKRYHAFFFCYAPKTICMVQNLLFVSFGHEPDGCLGYLHWSGRFWSTVIF